MEYTRVQQEFIGRSFGAGEHLTVVGVGTKQGDKQMYRVYCSVCAQDHELFGDGVFEMTKGNLVKGAIPCGCAKNPWWSEQQNIIRAKRKLAGTHTSFVGVAEPYKGIETKITLHCNKHNLTWSLTTFHTLFGKRTRGMCIECEKELISERKTEDEDLSLETILATGSFPEGSTFWRTPVKRPSRGFASAGNMWGFLCGICSYDEYVEEGLCDGVFVTTISDLKNGRRPCRCSGHFRWTLAQKEYQIRKQAELNDSVEFVSLKYTRRGFKHTSKLEFWGHCKIHGEFSSSAGHVDARGLTCPKCSRFGYQSTKDGYVYVLKIEGDNGRFTGYGITNTPAQRLKEHRGSLKPHSLKIVESSFYKFTGEQAKAVERSLRKNFELFAQDVKGFRTEATYPELYREVSDFVRNQCSNDSEAFLSA